MMQSDGFRVDGASNNGRLKKKVPVMARMTRKTVIAGFRTNPPNEKWREVAVLLGLTAGLPRAYSPTTGIREL